MATPRLTYPLIPEPPEFPDLALIEAGPTTEQGGDPMFSFSPCPVDALFRATATL